MFVTLLWVGGLTWFVTRLPKAPLSIDIKAEALVVLTGGSGRVEHGLSMLADQIAPVLFISGVAPKVTQEQLLREHSSASVRARIYASGGEIILDRVSRSTVSNADQTASFLRERKIRRIRLITADYHMQRSVHEFRVAMPELEILADPVFPEKFRRENWWQDKTSRHLMFSEFYKYVAILVRDRVRPTKKPL
jgi:uncharacterized SAM-binding protein YcdF (DUF218 family)